MARGQVGSVVAVGLMQHVNGVRWATFRNIFLSWILTVPLTGLFSGVISYVLVYIFL